MDKKNTIRRKRNGVRSVKFLIELFDKIKDETEGQERKPDASFVVEESRLKKATSENSWNARHGYRIEYEPVEKNA